MMQTSKEFQKLCRRIVDDGQEWEMRRYLDYEIRSSWWASWVGIGWVQQLAGRYFAWKTKRKYVRYRQTKVWEQRIKAYQSKQNS